MKSIPGFAAALCLLFIAGCDSGTPEKGKAAADKKQPRYTAPPTIPNPIDASAPVEAIKRADPSKGTSQNSSTPQVAQVSTTAVPAINPAQEEATKAEVGVGKKGQYGDNYLEVVVAAKFRAEERIIFEIEIPHALDLYKAGHNNKGPKSHEEFWKEIIEPANIQNKLPELREGERYQYDPKTEELMIVRPKRGGK